MDPAIILFGLGVGLLVGMTGIGGGSLILLWAAAVAHIVAGNVDFALAGTILLGSVPGVWVGSHLSVRVPTGALRTTLAVVLLGSGLGLLAKAGVGIPGLVLGAVPVIAAALVGWSTFRDRRGRSDPTPAPAATARSRARQEAPLPAGPTGS